MLSVGNRSRNCQKFVHVFFPPQSCAFQENDQRGNFAFAIKINLCFSFTGRHQQKQVKADKNEHEINLKRLKQPETHKTRNRLRWMLRPASDIERRWKKNGKMFNKTIIISITFSSFPFAMPIDFNLRIACFLIFYLTADFFVSLSLLPRGP